MDRQAQVDSRTPLERTVNSKKVDIADPKAKAKILWRSCGQTKADGEILERLAFATGGKCSYCETNDLSGVDHFRPLSQFPEKSFVWSNFVGACAICNNCKSDQFETDGMGPLLVDPFVEDIRDFFGVSPSTGKLVPLGGSNTRSRQRAEYTAKVLGFDRFDKSRLIFWGDLCRTIVAYGGAVQAGDAARKVDLKRSILQRHNGLLAQMIYLAQRDCLHDADLKNAFEIAPEIASWLMVSVRDAHKLEPYIGQKPVRVTPCLKEIHLDYGEGNLLVLCGYLSDEGLAGLVNSFQSHGLSSVTASAGSLVLTCGDAVLSLDFGREQSMFLVEDDRLTAVW